MRANRYMTNVTPWACLIALAALCGFHPPSQAAQDPPAPAAATPTYDESADANADIAAALARAGRGNKRVMLMFGANWCHWCKLLDGVFRNDRDIARTMLYEYELVKVDIGRMSKNMDLAGKYEADLKNQGVPFLVVLDADGKPVVKQETGSLEDGDHHDPAKVKAFLEKWKAPAVDAAGQMAAALARAASEEKFVFLHLGAPWCGWCTRLEEFFSHQEVAELFGRDFVDLKIDVDRMTGGKELDAKLRSEEEGGLPWFAFLDAQGKVLVTSIGPKGNVGFPVEPHEVDHFAAMLKQVHKRLTDDDRAKIEQWLRENGQKILAGMKRQPDAKE